MTADARSALSETVETAIEHALMNGAAGFVVTAIRDHVTDALLAAGWQPPPPAQVADVAATNTDFQDVLKGKREYSLQPDRDPQYMRVIVDGRVVARVPKDPLVFPPPGTPDEDLLNDPYIAGLGSIPNPGGYAEAGRRPRSAGQDTS
jgi:hypothetical protein